MLTGRSGQGPLPRTSNVCRHVSSDVSGDNFAPMAVPFKSAIITGTRAGGQAAARPTLRIAGQIVAGLGLCVVEVLVGLIAVSTQPYWPMYAALIALAGGAVAAALLSRRFAVIIAVIAVVLTGVVTVSQVSASTPPITDAAGKIVPGSIAEMRTLNLGGVDQWVMIRGYNTSSPVLLYLAGGPGGTSYSLNREYNSELEKHFVVVNWEQMGAGKSAGALIANANHVAPQEYIAAGQQLTNYLRLRFHQDKIYLWGQSWGTMLGIWMIQRQPTWYAAYVGVGQMVNPVADDREIYNDVLQRARHSGDVQLEQKLESIGPPPYHGLFNMADYATVFGPNDDRMNALVEASGPPARAPLAGMTEGPEYGLADQVGAQLGLVLTFAVIYDQLDNVDLTREANFLKVPVYFAEGRFDLNARTDLVDQYLAALQAPSKQIVWFEHSGHNPAHEEAARFNDFMINTVRAQTQGE